MLAKCGLNQKRNMWVLNQIRVICGLNQIRAKCGLNKKMLSVV